MNYFWLIIYLGAFLCFISCNSSSGGLCNSRSINASKKNKTYLATYKVTEYEPYTPLPKPDSIILERCFMCSNTQSVTRLIDGYQFVCFNFKEMKNYDHLSNGSWRIKNMRSYDIDCRYNSFRLYFDKLPTDKVVLEFFVNDSLNTYVGKMVLEKVEE